MQVAELAGQNEQWQLQAALAKLHQAEQTAQQAQHSHSNSPTASPAQDSADVVRLQSQLEEMTRRHGALQSQLSSTEEALQQERADLEQQQQQAGDRAKHAAWDLQHQVDNLTGENKSLLDSHEKLQGQFESLTKQLAQAQHAQHAQHAAESRSKVAEAQQLSRSTALQQQVDSLMASSAGQVEQRHRLENEVAVLQRQLTTAESALSQHQHRVRSQEEAEAAASGQVAMLRQQADSVVADNAALEGQCAQQAADMKQLQSDVQVSCMCNTNNACSHTQVCIQTQVSMET